MSPSLHADADTGGHPGRRVFTMDDQRRFARLTGDVNPVHLEPMTARRTLVGQVVVHGLHTAAWALESYLDAQPQVDGASWRLTHISATFPKPVLLDRAVELHVIERGEESAHLRAFQDQVAVLDLRLRYGPSANLWDESAPQPPTTGDAPGTSLSEPLRRTEEQLHALKGTVAVVSSRSDVEAAFPAACAALGHKVVMQLLGLSTLVGMECPGLHSLLSGVAVTLAGDREQPEGTTDAAIAYEVRRFASTYSLVDIRVAATGLFGSVTAFLRPPPAAQPSVHEIAQHVTADEFSSHRALIVGGSRGLGELTAKIVAAGGGVPIVTYRRGEEDAQRVADEIAAADGRCLVAPFDVMQPAESVSAVLDVLEQAGAADLWPPTHLYYFATPRIFVRKANVFDDEVFASFTAFYVRGFVDAVMACVAAGAQGLKVLYPSSVAIDEGLAELSEYAAAKAAGEAAARMLDHSQPVHVTSVRLPRLPTDQTLNVQNTPAEPALPVMCTAVRALAAAPPSPRI